MVPWEHNQQTELIRTWKTIVKAENNSSAHHTVVPCPGKDPVFSANIASLLKFLLNRSFQIDFVECFTETTFENKNTHHFHILFISYINDSMRILKVLQNNPERRNQTRIFIISNFFFAKHGVHMDIKTF